MNNIVWKTHHLSIFKESVFLLKKEVESIKQKTPNKVSGHPRVKLYICIVRVLKEIENDPTQSQYHLGNTLGTKYRAWKRAKKGLPDRYRLFFIYFSNPNNKILIAWLNDEKTLRKDGAKTDCYTVFKKMLDSGKIPSMVEELKDTWIDFI